jgi:heme-degrading monooxygenase HmoA
MNRTVAEMRRKCEVGEASPLCFFPGGNGSHEDLEGASTEGTVILEFPSIEAAKAWYNGSPYRREHRFEGETYRVTLIEGVRSQPTQTHHWVEFVGAI